MGIEAPNIPDITVWRVRWLLHLINPDTGALGIEGVITNVAYDDDGQRATLTLDDDAKRLDYLLARVGAQVSA